MCLLSHGRWQHTASRFKSRPSARSYGARDTARTIRTADSSIISSAEKQLAACVAKRGESSVEIVPLLKQADPREAILAAAQDLSADLVVMGTHGRRGIARALIGSVAEAIVRVSPVPVLTVHAAA